MDAPVILTRRGFLQTCLALAVAPSIVRAESLMPLVIRTTWVLHGDGISDDTLALQAWLDGERVWMNGAVLGKTLRDGTFMLSRPLVISKVAHDMAMFGNWFNMKDRRPIIGFDPLNCYSVEI